MVVETSSVNSIITICIILLCLTFTRSILVMLGGNKIFKKASKKSSTAYYPILNLFTLLDITETSTFLGILFFVPVVNVVALSILFYRLGTAFNTSKLFKIGLVILPIIFYPILALGNKQYKLNDEEYFKALDNAKGESINLMTQEEVKAEEKKDNKKTKIILDIIIYVFIVVVMVCLVLLYFKRQEDNETIKEIEETVVPKEIEIVDEKTVKDYISDLQTKFNNNDIKGILNVEGLDVSIPIVKGKDNDYYLKHAVTKKKSVIGSVFIDYRNNTNSRQINIYGHNSTKFNPPFKVLEGYLNKDYYNEHKYFEFMVNDETRKYEIFSVIVANKDSSEEHMQFSYKKNSDWLKHFQRLQKKSKYKINVTVNKDDKIMVLQTCIFGRYHDKLLVIVGREIERK